MENNKNTIEKDNSLKNLEPISFWQLLSTINRIEIPIIQRDYVQGREDPKIVKIRKLFLDNLIKNIESDDSPLELDFIYGDIKNKIFQPLDGQQRLTTLYLIHWYLAYKTSNLELNKDQFIKFTYETRISSREFCNQLAECCGDIGEGETLAEKIKDSNWFFFSWERDPTIKSMLIMLNSIEAKLKEKSSEDLKIMWEKLKSENSPIIFYFKELNDIGLTDDLYIKMNARGKQLTPFENFKAQFNGYIKKNGFEKDLDISEQNNKSLEEVNKNRFSYRIDTIWTDLFWKFRDDKNLFDNEMIRFIAGIAINLYAENQVIYNNEEEDSIVSKQLKESKVINITSETIKRERIEIRIKELYNDPNEVKPEDFSDCSSFNYLKSCLDLYSNVENNYNELIPNSLIFWSFDSKKLICINDKEKYVNNLFIELIKEPTTEYRPRVLFYAQTQYLLNCENFNLSYFTDWMRVVRNIVQNSTIDSASTFIGAIGLIEELSNGCLDIYSYLNETPVKSNFGSSQVSEEILKSSIILEDKNNKEAIFRIENTEFFRGNIKFALYCINVNEKDDVFNYESCNKLCDVTILHLNSNDISNNFRRALLTIQDNKFYDYWSSWSYGVNAYKKCLIKNTKSLSTYFTKGRYIDYLKELLLSLFEKSLDDILIEYECPDDMPKWKCRLIKESELLEKYCSGHYFGIPKDESCCYLFYHRKRPSSREDCKKIK